MWGSMA